MIVYLLLKAVALLLGITCLDSDLRWAWYTRRNQWTLNSLEEYTGLSRRALLDRFGPPGPDRLLDVPPTALTDLPRAPRSNPYHPLANGLAVAILGVGLASALASGAPAWRSLAVGGGYLLVCLLVILRGLWWAEHEPDDLDRDLDAVERQLTRLEHDGEAGPRTQSLRLLSITDQLDESSRRSLDDLYPDPTDPTILRIVWWVYRAWLVRQLDHVKGQAEQLVHEVDEARKRLKRMLDDLDDDRG